MCKVVIADQSCGRRDFRELKVAFGDMKNCQLKCVFCFTREQKPATDNLSNLGKIKMEGLKLVRFTGGEPLLSQAQIDGMIRELFEIEKKNLSKLDLIVLQTNALRVEERNLDGFLKLDLPILFEVSLKGSNLREYSYLTFETPISIERAKMILDQQVRGYVHLVEKFQDKKNIAVLARLGIFHSSVNTPKFKFVYPDTGKLMFNPNDWVPEILGIYVDQIRIWGETSITN